MTDLLLYFTLCLLAAIVVCAALFWLKRPERVEAQRIHIPKNAFTAEFSLTAYLSDKDAKTFQSWLDTEEFTIRPLGVSHDDILDSFDYEELWEAAANIPRESRVQREQIDKWVNEAFKDAGEDYEL